MDQSRSEKNEEDLSEAASEGGENRFKKAGLARTVKVNNSKNQQYQQSNLEAGTTQSTSQNEGFRYDSIAADIRMQQSEVTKPQSVPVQNIPTHEPLP